MMQLNLGCGPKAADGWVNVDAAVGARLARLPLFRRINNTVHIVRAPWPPGIVIHDLRKPLPWPNESIDGIYCSHVLEHFTRLQGERLLAECFRVARPGGVLRVVVPDLAFAVNSYATGRTDAREFLDTLDVGGTDDRDGFIRQRLAWLVRFPHKCMYDEAALLDALTCVGFRARVRNPLQSLLINLSKLEAIGDPRRVVIVEGMKETD
jgi:SAM-dependent methyltransferase